MEVLSQKDSCVKDLRAGEEVNTGKFELRLSQDSVNYLIQNLFSVVMYPFKPLAGTPTEEFLTFTTVVGDGVNAGMSFQYLTT